VDAATSPERQRYVLQHIYHILQKEFQFDNKDLAREFFYELRQKFIDWNYLPMESEDFKKQEKLINKLIKGMGEDEPGV